MNALVVFLLAFVVFHFDIKFVDVGCLEYFFYVVLGKLTIILLKHNYVNGCYFSNVVEFYNSLLTCVMCKDYRIIQREF